MMFQDDGFYTDDASIIKDGISDFVCRVILSRYTTLRSNRVRDKNRIGDMEKEVETLYASERQRNSKLAAPTDDHRPLMFR